MKPGAPVLHGAACARASLPIALCDTCARACPAEAIDLPPGGPARIDKAACIGCGACAASCPEAAFDPVAPLPGPQDRVWSLACAGADPSASFCLNAISLADLALARRRGVRALEVAAHDCTNCPHAGGTPLTETLARFNAFLKDRALTPLKLLKGARPRRGWLARLGGGQTPDPARRAMFHGGEERDARKDALREMLASAPENAERRFPFAPSLSPARCTGCDACIRGCPTGALRLVEPEGETGSPAYEIAAEACTGCGWCVALCDSDAITITLDSPAGAPVPLRAFQCRSCKLQVHRPQTGADTEEALCNICAEREYSRPDLLVL